MVMALNLILVGIVLFFVVLIGIFNGIKKATKEIYLAQKREEIQEIKNKKQMIEF